MPLPLGSYGTKVAEDTFTEAANTGLASHTPDQDDSGGGWTVNDGTLTVLAASDVLQGAEPNSDNIARLASLNLAGDFLVVCDIRATAATLGSSIHYGGPRAFDPAGGGVDVSYNVADSEIIASYWTPTDGAAASASGFTIPSTAWTQSFHQVALERVGNLVYLWVDGNQEGAALDLTGTTLEDKTLVPGVMLGNFATGTSRLEIDNYVVRGPSTVSSSPRCIPGNAAKVGAGIWV